MTRSSKDQKDQDEKKVLFELVKNSKEKLETISKHCGFSRPKTWRIIKQLEEKNMIWGYTAIFNEEKIGLSHFVLMLKRTIKQPGEATVDKIILRKLEGLVEECGTELGGRKRLYVARLHPEGEPSVEQIDDIRSLAGGNRRGYLLLVTLVGKCYLLDRDARILGLELLDEVVHQVDLGLVEVLPVGDGDVRLGRKRSSKKQGNE